MESIRKIKTNQIFKYGLLLILIAIILNSSIYLIANLFEIFNDEVINPNTNEPILMSEIVIVSIFQMVIGLIGFAFTTEISQKPIKLYKFMASIFLIISFYFPFTIDNATITTLIALELMHFVSGFLMIIVLPQLLTRELLEEIELGKNND